MTILAWFFVPCIVHALWNTEWSTSVWDFVILYIIDSRTLNEIIIFKIWFERLLAGYGLLYNGFAAGNKNINTVLLFQKNWTCWWLFYGRTTEQQYSIATSFVFFLTKIHDLGKWYKTVFFTVKCAVLWLFSFASLQFECTW